MSYANQRLAAKAVAVASGALLLINAANQSVLGIPPWASAWLGILAGVLALVASYLPNVRATSRDPDFLAARIRELPPRKRIRLATKMADDAEQATPRG